MVCGLRLCQRKGEHRSHRQARWRLPFAGLFRPRRICQQQLYNGPSWIGEQRRPRFSRRRLESKSIATRVEAREIVALLRASAGASTFITNSRESSALAALASRAEVSFRQNWMATKQSSSVPWTATPTSHIHSSPNSSKAADRTGVGISKSQRQRADDEEA